MPQLNLPGRKGRSEKYILAEQKNRLERTRLELNQKFYDREAFKTKFRIDREKKLVLRAFDLVKRTSGRSDEGCAPDHPHDREYEKSLVFTNGLRLTELRLNNWRHLEKDLHVFLSSIERDIENMSPTNSQKDRFLSQEKYSNLLMKGIGLTPTKRPATAIGIRSKVRTPREESIHSESEYSYGYDSESEEESDDSEDSLTSASSIEPRISNRSNASVRQSPGAIGSPRKVTFARCNTAGTLPRTISQQEPRPSVQETTHFLITKDGVLMNTGGEYKPIHIKRREAPAPIVKTAATTLAPAKSVNARKNSSMSFRRLQSEEDLPTTPVPGVKTKRKSSPRNVFSPCSETSSIMFSYSDTPKSRSAPSPISNLPRRLYPPLGRPNSRLGIFLPAEKEFSKRQHFSNRQFHDFIQDIHHQHTIHEKTNAWKTRLVSGQASHVGIRSMKSMATVLRAALAFSRKRRQSILKDMLREENRLGKQTSERQKKSGDLLQRQTSEIDTFWPCFFLSLLTRLRGLTLVLNVGLVQFEKGTHRSRTVPVPCKCYSYRFRNTWELKERDRDILKTTDLKLS